jgi:hypothetical protein
MLRSRCLRRCMAYFLNLFSPETWKSFAEHGSDISGFSPRQRASANRIQPGDIFLCYLVGLSRWCGALRVVQGPFEDGTPIYADPDPFTIRFKVEPVAMLTPEESVPVFLDEIWTQLSLTRDIQKGASGWAAGFRGSLRSLTPEDGDLLMAKIATQANERIKYPLTDRDKRQLARRATIASQKGAVVVEVPEDEEANVAGTLVQSESSDEEVRASLKIQASLAKLGAVLGFKIWIAPGDRKKVSAQDGVDASALLEKLPFNYETVTMSTIEQIDVIWIWKRSIARAFEVEHTTAIYSGLLRMADLLALQPNLDIKLHIVAPDDKREKVLRELRRPVFSLLENGPLYDSCTYL